MNALRLVLAKIRALVRRDVVSDEIRDEMQFHVDMRAAEYERAGVPGEDAKRVATRRFGNLTLMQDRGYDVRGGGVLETVVQDIRYGVRLLLKDRGFSFVAVTTLALGIGVSAMLFSVIDAALLRPLPFPNPDQLVKPSVEEPRSGGRITNASPSVDDARLWQSAGVFSAVAVWNDLLFDRITEGPSPERVQVREVTEQYLSVLGVRPILGRDFTADDTTMGAPDVVILGYRYWQRRYGADPAVLGQIVRYDDLSATIVGVLPAGVYEDRSVWRPMRKDAGSASRRNQGNSTWARLRPEVSRADAEVRLSALTPRPQPPTVAAPGALSAQLAPADDRRPHVRLGSILDETRSNYRQIANILAGAVALVFLLACVNVSGLLLARGADRHTELVVRASIGAGRLRLVRQLLTENLILSLAGGVAGLVLAWLSLEALVSVLPVSLPENAPVEISMRILVATAVLTVATAILFGVVPAVRLTRLRQGLAVSAGTRRHGAALSKRVGQLLIAAEVGLAVVLVLGAGLMIRSFSRLLAVDIGFNPSSILTMEVTPVDADNTARARYYANLVASLQGVPGVAAAGAVDHFVLSEGSSVTAAFGTEGPTPMHSRDVLPGYFEAIGLPLRQGRLPTATDFAGGSKVAVITETAARRLFSDGLAAGRTFERASMRGREPWTVIAVVGDVRHGGPLRRPQPEMFVPLSGDGEGLHAGLAVTVVVRANGSSAGLADRMRAAAQSVGPTVLVERIRTGGDWFADRVSTPRHRLVLLGLLGGLGLTLALVGIFGMTAYAVARRTQEIGVRMAFGARPSQVVGTMVGDAARPMAIGLAAGLVAAYFATGVIKSFLFETTPQDPITFAAVAIGMALAAVLAAWVPARRAANVDPVVALRAE